MSLKSYSRIYWLGIKLMIIIPGDFRFPKSADLASPYVLRRSYPVRQTETEWSASVCFKIEGVI